VVHWPMCWIHAMYPHCPTTQHSCFLHVESIYHHWHQVAE
jgi:hypothetical protein